MALPEGFIPHDGGPCPVPLNSTPCVLFRDGESADETWDILPTAGTWIFPLGSQNLWEWSHHGPADIIAYKPEPKP